MNNRHDYNIAMYLFSVMCVCDSPHTFYSVTVLSFWLFIILHSIYANEIQDVISGTFHYVQSDNLFQKIMQTLNYLAYVLL